MGGFRASQERGAVFVFEQKGNTAEVYEYDKGQQPLFRYPNTLITITDSKMIVADNHPKDGFGRVVVIGIDGSVSNIYLGHPTVNKETLFRPISLVKPSGSNVIVSDFESHTFHILVFAIL